MSAACLRSMTKAEQVSELWTAPVLHQLDRTLDSTTKRASAQESRHCNLGKLQELLCVYCVRSHRGAYPFVTFLTQNSIYGFELDC